MTGLHAWQPLVSDGSIRWLKYSFGAATANTLAARLDDGTWLVVSPATGAPAEALEALAKDGDVSALIAPNGFHHLGQAQWRARFTKAKSYAPADSLARLTKKSPGIDYLPLGELALPARMGLLYPDGMKAPDVMLNVSSGGDRVWFSGDILSNTIDSDVKPIPRFIFSLLGGGPGYRFNKAPALFYLRDRMAWKRSVLSAFEAAPPTVVLPAHGDPVTDDVASRSRTILA